MSPLPTYSLLIQAEWSLKELMYFFFLHFLGIGALETVKLMDFRSTNSLVGS